MRYLALCCDYDGTLAHDGAVNAPTRAALERCVRAGRRLLLVTGRELPELKQVCSCLDLFSYVVAENGALLYCPATGEERALAAPAPQRFIAGLRERGVQPISVGRVIVATWEPHQAAVLETIHDLGLELQVIFNKGAVMVLPAGVNKASGLHHALEALGLSAHNAVAVGDAENDQAFLAACGCGVAVGNALPALKERADFVTRATHGAGVCELIEELIATDLAGRAERLGRHDLLLGEEVRGGELRLHPGDAHVLVLAGEAGAEAALVGALIARIAEQRYSYCLLDPAGHYGQLPGAIQLGNAQRPPTIEEIVQLFAKPDESAVIHLSGLARAERSAFLVALLPRLEEQRARNARPHWLALGDAHELWPSTRYPAGLPTPASLRSLLEITSHPQLLPAEVLADANTVLAVGRESQALLQSLGAALGELPTSAALQSASSAQMLAPHEALLWVRGGDLALERVQFAAMRTPEAGACAPQ